MATISAVGRAPSTGLTAERTEEGRAFLQRRVARFGLFGGGIGGSFLVLRIAVGAVTGQLHLLFEMSMLAHLCGVLFLLVAWAICRSGARSVRVVETVELICVAGSCFSYQAMGTALPLIERPDMIVHAAMTFGLIARAIYVPSTARRTLGIGIVIGVGYVAMVYTLFQALPEGLMDLVRENYKAGTRAGYRNIITVFAAVWWAGTVAVSTAASRVVYGLRREVRNIKRLGQYTLLEKLGEGGMGSVHRASHAMLQRPTAVKLLPPDKIGERSVERFEREVQLTAKLTHPNTITVFDYGRTPDGVFYYAMEHLEGANLAEAVEATGPMPPGRVLHVLAQVLGALSEAHHIGLIHRDVKPQNIMLCERGEMLDYVKVLDFGLVKHVESQDATLTGSNVITGTPHFMPPEALKNPDKVDARSDLYSLGIVAYFMITAELPFEGESIVEICGHQLHTVPEPPSKRVPDVPADIEALLLACLEKDPEKRPQSAREMRDALTKCEAHGSWTEADAKAWWDAYRGEA